MKHAQITKSGWLVMFLAALGIFGLVFRPAIADARDNWVELEDNSGRVIELAICLDASGSMDGLIDAAKQKLWAIVNDLALAEPTPELRVALLIYGNDGLAVENGWVKVETPFTRDLDLVSQRLFAITTNGGTEYVGRVLNRAGQLHWSPSANALQLIVVAGNESADQDQVVRYRDICGNLIGRGIMVNAIYCGGPEDHDAPGWREVATIAEGKFATIDHDHGTVVVATPFDDQLSQLSAQLNKTYIPFGAHGAAGAANQEAQDANAATTNPATSAQRAASKSSALYKCAWDLVDACKSGDVEIAEVDDEDLPEPMRGMSKDERTAYVKEMAAKRSNIQEQIAELGEKREAFVQEEMKRKALDDSKSFDNAMRDAIHEQAEKRGIRFKKTITTTAATSAASTESEPKAGLVRLVSSPVSPVMDDFTADERSAIATVFGNASKVRDGRAEDLRWLANGDKVQPDVVVSVGKSDDWDLLRDTLKPDHLTEIPGGGGMILSVQGESVLLILLTDGC